MKCAMKIRTCSPLTTTLDSFIVDDEILSDHIYTDTEMRYRSYQITKSIVLSQ